MTPARKELKELLRLAIPLAAAQAGTQLMGVVDTAVVGRLGSLELGACGLGNSIFFALTVIGMGLVMGVDPLASQAFGAGDALRARRVLWQGVWLSFLVGAALSVPMYLSPLLLRSIGIDRAIVDEATPFILIRGLSLVPSLLFIVLRSYLQAQGITRPMVTAMVIGNVFNFLADVLLVFGGAGLPWWLGFLRWVPAFGLAGAAIASTIGSVIQVAIVAHAIQPYDSGSDPVHRPIARDIRQALNVGLPIGLQWGAEVGIFALVGLMAARLGSQQLAAHQVALTLASLTFTVAVGVGAAGSVRVGRAIGARDPVATRRAGFVAFVGGMAVMSCSALLFLLFPTQLARLLSDQPDVIFVAAPLLSVAAMFQISDGTQAVGGGVLRGAGDTRFPFYANLVGHWVIGLPVALFLGFRLRLGIVGLWWGLCAGLTIVAILLFLRFYRMSQREIAPLT